MGETRFLQADFLERVDAIILHLKAQHDIGIEIASGYRSMDDQAALYAKGRTTLGKKVTNARPGQSYHNFGVAADFCLAAPVIEKGKPTKFPDKHVVWDRIGEAATLYGLRWGGTFKTIVDRPHVEWPIPLKTLQQWHQEGGLDLVWKKIGELAHAAS